MSSSITYPALLCRKCGELKQWGCFALTTGYGGKRTPRRTCRECDNASHKRNRELRDARRGHSGPKQKRVAIAAFNKWREAWRRDEEPDR